ncbi:MAG: ABC transporter ATP-binding protein [Chthonomonadaceae bacterium]|nr:ABC transporter ATP-binding protein [Chthonomonadaceae bacterium]
MSLSQNPMMNAAISPPSNAGAMISLERASRWYNQVIGINDVTCKIPTGITALLGPNGAGKSTMLKLITGQLKPTTGQVTIFGMKPFANPNVYRRMGYCPEIENNYDEMTGRQFVTMLGAMAGIGRNELGKRVNDAIEQVGMTANGDRKIGGYSKGMRQRIKVAQGIIHRPDILVLDEPLNGLDPIGRRDMMNVLNDFASEGKGVLISSHILYEVEQMTSNILLMSKGRLLAQGNIYQIRGLIDKHPHRISIETNTPRPLASLLLSLPFILSVKFDRENPRMMEIETLEPDKFYSQFPEIIMAENLSVDSFDSPDNNLEAVFKYLITG